VASGNYPVNYEITPMVMIGFGVYKHSEFCCKYRDPATMGHTYIHTSYIQHRDFRDPLSTGYRHRPGKRSTNKITVPSQFTSSR